MLGSRVSLPPALAPALAPAPPPPPPAPEQTGWYGSNCCCMDGCSCDHLMFTMWLRSSSAFSMLGSSAAVLSPGAGRWWPRLVVFGDGMKRGVLASDCTSEHTCRRFAQQMRKKGAKSRSSANQHRNAIAYRACLIRLRFTSNTHLTSPYLISNTHLTSPHLPSPHLKLSPRLKISPNVPSPEYT